MTRKPRYHTALSTEEAAAQEHHAQEHLAKFLTREYGLLELLAETPELEMAYEMADLETRIAHM